MDAGLSLKLPELRAVRLVERAQAAVVAADEDEAAARDRRARVAELAPLLAPRESIRSDVDGREHAALRHARARVLPAEVAAARLRHDPLDAAFLRRVRRGAIARADVEQIRLGVVRARRPIRAARAERLHDDGLVPERRENAAVVDELEALGLDVDLVRNDLVASRNRLRRRGRLPRLLRHRYLVDGDERLARLAIEDVDVARLADLDDALAQPAVVHGVEQHDGIRRVVVPEIVMHLLEVPAVPARLHLDRDHRDAEEIVAGPHGAVEIGTRVARREIDEAELGIDGRRLPDGGAAMLPRVIVARPGVVPGFAGTRDRVEGPHELAVVRVVSLHAAAHRAVAAG